LVPVFGTGTSLKNNLCFWLELGSDRDRVLHQPPEVDAVVFGGFGGGWYIRVKCLIIDDDFFDNDENIIKMRQK
jgi:hypothetical protein